VSVSLVEEQDLMVMPFAMSDRIRHMREELLQTVPRVCTERARIYTRVYRSFEGDPPILRRARALSRTLDEMSIMIFRDELLVGNQASQIRGAPIFPEYSSDWIEEEIDQFARRPGDVFEITEEDKKILLSEILPYWKGRTLYDRAMSIIPESVKKAQEIGVISGRGNITSGDGHLIVNFEKVLRLGLRGIIEETTRHMEALSEGDPFYLKKQVFYQSVLLVLEAAIRFAHRYAQLLTLEAAMTTNPERRRELLEMAGNVRVVPENPPRTFWQAVQSIWFIHLLTQIESNGHSFSLGRVDQYLYPYWKRDFEAGNLTLERTVELLQSLFVKMFTINKIRPWSHTQFGIGYATYQNVTIGGQDIRGQDATNELTYLILKAVGGLRLTTPNLSARFHALSPRSYLRECARVIRLGFGMPAMKNDEIIIPALLDKGVTIEDARNYAIVGCVEAAVPGKWGYRNTGMTFLNVLKILELTLHGGRCPQSGVMLCSTRPPEACPDFESFYREFQRQLFFYTKCQVLMDATADLALEELVPDAFCSALVEDCLSRGKHIKEGGAVYDVVSGLFSGLANVANSLANIRELVYRRKVLTWQELLEALCNDFSGYRGEMVRKLLLEEVPKYGNDVDAVDMLASRVLGDYLEEIKKYRNTRYGRGPIGGNYCGSTSNISANVPLGMSVGATPDGRRAREPIAEGVSPFYGTEKSGPTAVLKSVSKLQTVKMIAQLLNLKFAPAVLATEEGLQKLVQLFTVFFRDLKGWHVQFNVVDAETLRDAQKHPERYRDLIVRVAGYSALFIALDPRTQEDIIRRTEHTL
jgi:pyruvate formate-lyase/glycerol dehydratase family glycyl radical enzyme